jgi:hypothetical protein
MTIIDYFNPQSVKHLEQFLKYQRTGSFDDCFLPYNVEITPNFFAEIQSKIIKHHIAKHLTPVVEK